MEYIKFHITSIKFKEEQREEQHVENAPVYIKHKQQFPQTSSLP